MKTIILFLLAPALMFAQMKRIITNADDLFEIPEIGGVVIQEKAQLKVDMVMPAENRPKAYKDVDIKTGDLLLMMNGKKIDNSKNASEIYKQLRIGEEVKFGIKRGEQMFIASFRKADPKDLPKRKRVIIKDGDMKEHIVFLQDEGLLIGSEKGKVVVKSKTKDSKSKLQEGDELTELNGKPVKSAEEFSSKYLSIKTGEKLELKFRNGKTIITKKPDDEGKAIIKRDIK